MAKNRPQGVSISLLSRSILVLRTALTQVASLRSFNPRHQAGNAESATPRRQTHSDLLLLLRRNTFDCAYAVRFQEANTKWCKHLFIQIKKTKKKKKNLTAVLIPLINQTHTHTHAKKKKKKKEKEAK